MRHWKYARRQTAERVYFGKPGPTVENLLAMLWDLRKTKRKLHQYAKEMRARESPLPPSHTRKHGGRWSKLRRKA